MFRVLALIVYLTLIPGQSEAFVFEYGGEKVVKLMELPDTDIYKTREGDYFDVGVVYKRFRIFWITVWNYDIRWCGYTEDGAKYVPFTYEELKQFTDIASLPLNEDEPQLPFWDAWGGKLLIVSILISVILWIIIQVRKE